MPMAGHSAPQESLINTDLAIFSVCQSMRAINPRGGKSKARPWRSSKRSANRDSVAQQPP
jgi:hypothetical protein